MRKALSFTFIYSGGEKNWKEKYILLPLLNVTYLVPFYQSAWEIKLNYELLLQIFFLKFQKRIVDKLKAAKPLLNQCSIFDNATTYAAQ